MFSEPVKTVGILIERRQRYGTEYVIAKAMLREDGASHPINATGSGFSRERQELDGLAISGHVYQYRDDPPELIGADPEYRDLHSIDRRRAEIMAKCLKRIEARIAKDDSREYGDVLLSFARAIGASWIVECADDTGRTSYCDNAWRFMSLTEGRNRYRDMIRAACDDVAKSGAGRL